MPLAKNRELIPVSSQAHKRLKTIVDAMKKNGIPTNGTLLVSQVIMSMPIPAAPQGEVKKRRTPKRATAQAAAL